MIKLQAISCGYDKAEVLKDLQLELPDSGFTALVGPNGAGKSTLLYTLMGYLRPLKGEVSLYGKDIRQIPPLDLAQHLAFIPQEQTNEFDYTVLDTILMGRYPYLNIWQNYAKADYDAAAAAMAEMRLEALKERHLSQLSGGEKQRVYIARALVQDTKYILLDESLSQLDINYQVEIMRLLKKICSQQGKAIILVSHNLNLAANNADRILMLKKGRLLRAGTPQELMQEALIEELFGLKLMLSKNPISGVNNIIYP